MAQPPAPADVFARNFVPPRPAFGLTPPLRALVRSLQERRARTAADRELARRVQAAVDGARALRAGGLSFYVHDGTIAVYGSVRDEEAREAVLALAADQPGARRVIDHLARHEADPLAEPAAPGPPALPPLG